MITNWSQLVLSIANKGVALVNWSPWATA